MSFRGYMSGNIYENVSATQPTIEALTGTKNSGASLDRDEVDQQNK
jgi:hypothetical protein